MRANYLLAFLAPLLFFSCKKESEEFQTEALSTYLPTEVGKSITYRLDSTVFTNFGATQEIRSYQEKHVIDAKSSDNSGRSTYRIFRYLRDTAGSNPWVSVGSYFITPSGNTIEVSENNLRTIKLASPIVQDKTWKGNRFLPAQPYINQYDFSNDDGMDEWDFIYESVNESFRYKQQNLTNVVSVSQINDQNNLDTIDVVNNKATIPQNSSAVWLRGSATDTVIVNAPPPTLGDDQLTIYNRTNQFVSLNSIVIPSNLALSFQFSENKWSYPNPLTVNNNRVAVSRNVSIIYIVGVASGNINVNVDQIDTSNIKRLSIYNRSNFNAFCNFNTQLNAISIPPGFGRIYELKDGQWRLLDNLNILLNKDPFINDLPFGSKNFSVEKYAKGIGLIFQQLDMWEYQPPTSGRSGYRGFGVKRSIIDHN